VWFGVAVVGFTPGLKAGTLSLSQGGTVRYRRLLFVGGRSGERVVSAFSSFSALAILAAFFAFATLTALSTFAAFSLTTG
jgi:hypothetical protein